MKGKEPLSKRKSYLSKRKKKRKKKGKSYLSKRKRRKTWVEEGKELPVEEEEENG